jgi:hypothetical protein
MRAEERLLLRDEIGALQVAEQRARASRAAPQVDGHGEADGCDPDDLEGVTQPPAELAVVEQERSRERCRKPDDADDDQEIRSTPREPERAQRAPEEEAVERESRSERRPRGRASGLGDGGDERGLDERGDTECEDEEDASPEEPEQRTNGGGAAKR